MLHDRAALAYTLSLLPLSIASTRLESPGKILSRTRYGIVPHRLQPCTVYGD